MAHYMLYFPGADTPDDAVLVKAGLSQLLNTGAPAFWTQVITGGPDGGRGMLCTWMGTDNTRNPDPGQHRSFTWTPAVADRSRGLEASRFWFGVNPQQPVHPFDLQLSRRFFGYEVALSDGNTWHIPSASRLPHQYGLNEDGVWDRRIAKQYQAFYDRAMTYCEMIFLQVDAADIAKQAKPDMPDDEKIVSFTLDDAATHCCEALALNYRVTPEIIDFLGCLDDMTMVAIIVATIDLPEIRNVLDQKKNGYRVDIPVG